MKNNELPLGASDLISLNIPKPSQVNFPDERQKILQMFEQDKKQQAQMGLDITKIRKLEKDFFKRGHALSDILKKISLPTVANIGMDGSRAAWIIAQHSSVDVMQMFLKKMESAYKKDPESVFYYGIPFLRDRLRMIQHKKQLYGTQYYSLDGKTIHIYPVYDLKNLDKRRLEFNLRPLNLKTNGKWPSV